LSSDELEGKKEQSVNAQRPNMNYNLSPDKTSDQNEGITFYYSRERRLANAPKEVQDLYKETKPNRLGLIGPLVADRPRRILFFMIILLCLTILMLSRLGFFDTTYIIEGNKIEISGTGFEGVSIMILRKTIHNRTAVYSGAVNIAVSPVVQPGEDYSVFYHRVFFSLENEEEYRFSVPFDSPELLLVLQTEKSSLNINVKVD